MELKPRAIFFATPGWQGDAGGLGVFGGMDAGLLDCDDVAGDAASDITVESAGECA